MNASRKLQDISIYETKQLQEKSRFPRNKYRAKITTRAKKLTLVIRLKLLYS